jgi:alpha-D-xyloside xylohydrolase
MDTLVPHLQPSGIVDFTNPEAYAWFRDMHRPLIEMGVAVMKPDYGEAVPEEVIGYNGDSGRRLHNVYSLLYNRCVLGLSSATLAKKTPWYDAPVGPAASTMQWGGDPRAIGKSGGKHPQRSFLGIERRAVLHPTSAASTARR